jgi:hypothetical protein
MSDELTGLAAEAGRVLVQAMVTDGWAAVRGRMAGLFGRGDAERARRAAVQLDAARDGVRSGQLEAAAAASRWQGRIESLIEHHPELVGELRALLAEFDRGRVAAVGVGNRAVNADRGSYAAGGDMHLDQRQDHRRSRTVKTGGLLVAAVAVAVVVAVLLLGRAVFVNVERALDPAASMDEATTCAEFLAADSATQASVMKQLYLKYGRADRAADPFIVQNAQYACGSRPNMTLGQLAD